MSSLRMVEAKLPPGFRFHPRDDELVCDYLLKKWTTTTTTISSPHHQSPLLTDVDLNKCEPWDIPERACIGGKEWYFYSQRDRKYATGLRTNRATVSGYWKATGKDRAVVRRGSLVGMRKTLVFYQGRAPKGIKTQWVMHEFRVEGPFGPPKLSPPSKEDWVLCRVFFKNKDSPTKSSTDNDSNNNNNKSVDETRGSSSSSVAPMTDSYIAFDQTQPNTDAYQQVPCFSIYSANQNNTNQLNPTNNIIFPQNYHMDPNNNNNAKNNNNNQRNPNNNNNNNKNNNNNTGGGSIIAEIENNSNLNRVACDKKVLEAVLSHLTKMETINGSPSLGEAVSSESYLSEVGLQQPTLWTHF